MDRVFLEAQLRNYRALVTRVDEHCRRVAVDYRPEIACRRGCDGCCRHLTLFPIEGFALAAALADLPAPAAEAIRVRARQATPAGPCPLLADGLCLLYPARPLICRTQGMPLLLGEGEGKRLDFCPDNFPGRTSFPAAAILDLDRLNSTLAGINLLFAAEALGNESSPEERRSIAEYLLVRLQREHCSGPGED